MIRILRVFRVFRVFKLVQYVGEAGLLVTAVRAGLRKITVFLFVVITSVIFLGSLMYVVEGGTSGFRARPRRPARRVLRWPLGGRIPVAGLSN